MLSRNFFPLRMYSVVLTLFIAFAMLSCSDDDATKAPSDIENPANDTDAPTAALTGIPDDGVVWNVITLNVSASDNQALDKVEVEVDGVLLTTSTVASFEVRLNTQTLDDGEHKITVRAIDKAGHEHEVDATITVRNVLVAMDVPEDIFAPGHNRRGFIFVSDKNGKVVVAQEYHAGESVRLKAPNFEDSEFYLTDVFYVSGLTTGAQTFTNVKRGTWVATGYDHYFVEYLGNYSGKATFNFTNPAPNSTYELSVAHASTEFSGQSAVAIDMYSASSKLFIARQATRTESNTPYPTHYTVLPNHVAGGTTTSIDLSTVTQPTIEQTVQSEFATGSMMLWGVTNPARPRELHSITTAYCVNHVLKYNYPGNAFPEYYHQYFYETGDGEYYYNYLNGLPTLDKLECTVDLAITSTRFTGTVTGDDVDAYFINLSNGSQGWKIIASPGEQDIILPEIPAILSGIMVRNYVPNQTTVTAIDFSAFDGYENFLDYIRGSTYGTEGIDEIGGTRQRKYTKYLFWNGGSGRLPASEQTLPGLGRSVLHR